MARYIKCPKCGLSDGHDDIIKSSRVVDTTYNGDEVVMLEERMCDICGTTRKVKMHYSFNYEELLY